MKIRSIGRVCYEDDDYILSSSLHTSCDSRPSSGSVYSDGYQTMYSLKHRYKVSYLSKVLTFLSGVIFKTI